MAEAMIIEKYVQQQETIPHQPQPSQATNILKQHQPQQQQHQHPSQETNAMSHDSRDPSNTTANLPSPSPQRKYKVNFDLPPTKRSKRHDNGNVQNVISGRFKCDHTLGFLTNLFFYGFGFQK